MSDKIDISREAVAWARMTLDADFIEMGETTTYSNDTITEVIRKLNIALSRMSALRAALDAAEAERVRVVEALHFYADFYENPNDGPWGFNSEDFGKVARKALDASHE